MSQAGYTPISLYYSTTAAAVPTSGNLVAGELAINTLDGKLYYKNSAGTVTLLASTSGASGDVVGPASATDNALARFDLTTGKLIQNSVGILSDAGILTGLTGLTSSGSITFSSLTSGRVTYAGASGLLTDSANLTFSGSILAVTGTQTITNSSGSTLTLDRTSNPGSVQLNFNGTQTGQVQALSGGGLVFYQGSSPTEGFRLTPTSLYTASGVNVGIGVSNPNASLSVINSTMNNQILVGANTDSTAYGAISFSGGLSNATRLGFTAGATGNPSLYLDVPATGAFNFRIATDTKMLLDSSGNLGLGVTPSAWRTTDRAFEIGGVGKSLMAPVSGNSIYLATNWYISTAPANVYAANGLATRYAQSDGIHTWWNAPNNTSGAGAALTFTQAMTLNDSGNLSLSITPSAWGSTYKAFQAGGYAAYVGDGNNGYAEILNNAYASNNNIFNYYDTNSAGRYSIQLGAHKWFSTGSGSANSQITWTQAMTLDTSGNLGIGTTSPSSFTTFPSKLVVGNGTGGQHITIYSGTASEGDIVFADGTTGADQYRGTFRYDHADDSMKFYTGGGTLGIVQNPSGNLGLGVTPSPWQTSLGSRAIQFTGSSVYGYRDTNILLVQNAYLDSTTGGWKYYASSIPAAYSDIGSGVFGWFQAASGTAGGAISFTQAMTLNADGTLGIGSTGAGNKLTVSNAGANGFEVDPLSASGTKTKLLSLNRATSAYTPFLYDASLHEFQISGGQKMTLLASGDLLLGTATSYGGEKFTLDFTGSAQRGMIVRNTTSTTQDSVAFVVNSTFVGWISASTTGTTYNTISDYRLKNITGAVTGAKDFIMALQPKQGTWKSDGSKFVGFVAHEFAEVSPTSVSRSKDEIDEKGNPVYQGIQASSSEVMANLISLVQEQQALIESLTTRLTVLENK